MKKNMGNGDRFLRIIIGVLALILGLSGNFDGTLNWIILAVGVIMVVTSSMQFCPLYSLFGINTGKSKSEKSK